VRITFLVVALNDLDIWMSEVENAYLNAPLWKKIYTTAGPESGPEDEANW